MNKIMSAFMQEYHLDYDPKEKMFYGKMGEFQISGTAQYIWSQTNMLSFHVAVPEDRVGETNQFLSGIMKNYGIKRCKIAGDGIVCVLMATPKKYVACAQAIANYLSGIGAKGGCPFCGEELSEGARRVGSGSGIYIAHEHCFDEFCEKVRGEEAAEKAAPSNLWKAVGGMALGALAGALIWVVLYLIGYLAMIAPIAGALLGAYLWDRFGGKNDKTKIIALWVITLVIMTLTIFLTYYVSILNEMKNYPELQMSVFECFIEMCKVSEEFKNAVIMDTVVGYIFILAANIYVTVSVAQTQKLMSKSFRKF